MTTEEIKTLQRRIGVEPDGFFGPRSIAACQAHLRGLWPASGNPWPRPDDASITAFYGRPGDESQLVTFDFPYPMFYSGKRVLRSRCHRHVKDSLVRILTRIGDRWGHLPGIMEEAQDYGGIFNDRPMRGGTRRSKHAWGIAIDLDPDDNGNLTPWPHAADMPIEIMEEFAREGWTSAGAFWLRDAMHHEAVQPK